MQLLHWNQEFDLLWAIDMADYICVCEIVMHEMLASKKVLRAEVSVHAKCIGGHAAG